MNDTKYHKPTYQTWINMKERCYNKDEKNYRNYGARGITVCDRWLNSFYTFLNDMGRRPVGMVIDRIDNDSHYEPSNCRWVTRAESSRNTRRYRKDIPLKPGMTLYERSLVVSNHWHKEHPQYYHNYRLRNLEKLRNYDRSRYHARKAKRLEEGEKLK